MSTNDSSGRLMTALSWLRVPVSIGLLAVLIYLLDLGEAAEILAGASVPLIVLTFGVYIAERFLAAYRWYMLAVRNQPDFSYWQVLRLVFVSSFLGTFIPGSVGVEVIRVYGMSRSTSNLAASFSSVLVERLLAILALAFFVLFGLFLWPAALPVIITYSAWAVLLLMILSIAALFHPLLRRLSLWVLSPHFLARLRGLLLKIHDCVDEYRKERWLLFQATVVAVAFQGVRILAAVTGALALGISADYLYFLVMIPIVQFIVLLPVSFRGVGVQEVAFVYFLGMIGVAAEAAFTLSILLIILANLALLPGGWFYLRGGLYSRPTENKMAAQAEG